MEFLSLSRRRSSSRNVHSGEERRRNGCFRRLCFDKLSGSRIINEFLKKKFGTILSQVAFTPNTTYKSCYYLCILQPEKFSHVTPSVYFRRVVSLRRRANWFQSSCFWLSWCRHEPGRCSFLSILVF